MLYFSKVETDGTERERWELRDFPLIVGRGPRVDVKIDDTQASSMHFVVQRTGDALAILDLNSANGTWLNGHRIGQETLRVGDQIRLGKSTLVLREERAMGLNTAIREVTKEVAQTGKGYSTLLRDAYKKTE